MINFQKIREQIVTTKQYGLRLKTTKKVGIQVTGGLHRGHE